MKLFSTQTRHGRQALTDRWRRLYRLAYAWCHEPQTAMDLVQDCLTKALRAQNQLQDEKSLDPWLFSILLNCWRDHLRGRKETQELDLDSLESRDNPEQNHSRQQLMEHVRLAMTTLNGEQRQILTLVAIEGLSYDQVATIMSIPAGTVMSRLCRARQKLRDALAALEARPVDIHLRRVK